MSELILLSPYRLPTQSTQMLANDDVASFLNGYVCLWHPAAVHGAHRPPVVASPYDYEQPRPRQIFAIPESPPLLLPDDWDQRVIGAHAIAFRSTPSRETTLANFIQAITAFRQRDSVTEKTVEGENLEPLSGTMIHDGQASGSTEMTANRGDSNHPPLADLLSCPATLLPSFFWGWLWFSPSRRIV
jgi:hypothetical protein